jgi:hypothetical protein
MSKKYEIGLDDKIADTKDVVVGEDSRALVLTHYVLAERLLQVETASILEDHTKGDYTVIAELLSDGFRGYHNMSPGELWSQWVEAEEKFYHLYETDQLPWDMLEDDPLIALERDENGEVEAYAKTNDIGC